MKPTVLTLPKSHSYQFLRRAWPRVARKATSWLMPIELIGLVPILVIFGIAQPDMYRTDMWHIGFENKLNSNPNMILYAYANYRSLPKVPLIWSQTYVTCRDSLVASRCAKVRKKTNMSNLPISLTDFNVAISVISLFFLLSKLISHIMKLWYPIVAVFINSALVALYTVSTYGQIGPDYADARYPSPAAWYFRQGCGLAQRYGKYRACQVAQGSLFITLYMLVVYVLNLGFALYAMWPNPINDVDEDDEDRESTSSDPKERSTWEMQSMKSPVSVRESPFTPRTQAFHTLDRQLPLRQPKQAQRFA
ncbi:hypothetical protein MAC_06208 [Metarhizium acridum CQMa 102]|uniref:Uncharacterized protein n=1 Tax=Metarhizium acridum (strain CQMa 102) TaxID=655827 RepID=E9E8Q0_METAQ|nr:uncharacterized protein MAC_06208 [Metarhizium acridum CQMa 102]EFY87722.1 hypothetical protein MAC_06208 [Metarhizium acridum CQMa 102]